MIKKIIHCGDIHIRNNHRHEEYSIMLQKFIEECKSIAEPYEPDEVRILIAGDLFHSKNVISTESMPLAATFIRELEKIAKVILIAGNHDLIVNNQSKKDAITSLFETAQFENTYFLDYMLGFKSGTIVDDNITWAVYSIYDSYNTPEIKSIKEENPDNKVIGLFHAPVIGCSLPNGFVMESGISENVFEECDLVLCGDIHKQQELKYKGIPIVYCGSLIQQTYGETITQHGFLSWDIENMSYELIELTNDYAMYDIEINNISDIEENTEVLKNL